MIFVNVTIIYGTIRKASTYNCVQLLLNNLRLTMTINVTEFFLPKDLPYFCRGCFSCSTNSEDTCPHFNDIDYITNSLDESDLIILASPVVTCDISTHMKSLLDHLFYKSIENNTSSFMGNKIGLVMSTTAGAGLFHTTNILKRNLIFWGINNVFRFSKTLYEMNWEDVTLKTKVQINKKIFKLSNKILDLYIKSHPIKTPIFSKITSSKIEPIFKNNHCNVIDFGYWKRHSYLHGRRNIQ